MREFNIHTPAMPVIPPDLARLSALAASVSAQMQAARSLVAMPAVARLQAEAARSPIARLMREQVTAASYMTRATPCAST